MMMMVMVSLKNWNDVDSNNKSIAAASDTNSIEYVGDFNVNRHHICYQLCDSPYETMTHVFNFELIF